MEFRIAHRRRGFVGVFFIVCVGCSASKPPPSTSPTSAATTAPSSSSSTKNASAGCPSNAVPIDAGSFALASTKKSVTVKAHCLDRTEVTSAAYGACVKSGACSEPLPVAPEGYKKACNWQRPGSDDHPVNCVDFAQAQAYCAFVEGRLPSEAEWEWSARGYTNGWMFPWGNDMPNGRACWDEPDADDSPKTTCKVGSFTSGANPKGVLDLAGNVWEWTTSEDAKPDEAIDRGGGWVNGDAKRLLAGFRNVVEAKGRWPSVGFRCAYDR